MNFFKSHKDKILAQTKHIKHIIAVFLSAAAIGIVGGLIGAAFAQSISYVTGLRSANPWLIYLLPLGGLLSVAIYKVTHEEGIGTDRALESARGENRTPKMLVPVIFVASIITHLFGGSAGKEGAALQLGSGIAETVAKVTKPSEKLRPVLTISGMAALFSAVFGTPVGACVFAAEVAVTGFVNAFALVPAFVSSIVAFFVSTGLGTHPERFHLHNVPEVGVPVLLLTVLIAAIVALASSIFCHLLHSGEKFSAKLFKNPFIRIFVGGGVIILLTLVFGTDYNGGGMFVVERIFEEGMVHPEAFLLKILFTVVTVSVGFKGGEIVPSFFIGATLGAVISPLLGLPVEFGAAIGMTAFFSGVTNCPIAAAVLSVELFGVEGFALFAASAIIARIFSGNVSLYHHQKALLSIVSEDAAH